MAKPAKLMEIGSRSWSKGWLGGLQQAQFDQPQRKLYPEVERQAAAEELPRKRSRPSAGPAPPTPSARSAFLRIRQQIVDGKLPHEILLNEKVGEIKAQIIRARRPDPDGQGLSDSRPLRRCHVDRHRLLQAPRRSLPRSRHQGAQRREAPQPRHFYRHPRPWIGRSRSI